MVYDKMECLMICGHLGCAPTLHYLEASKVLLLLVASTTLAFDSNCLNSFSFGVTSYKSACEKFNENLLKIKQKSRPNLNNRLGL